MKNTWLHSIVLIVIAAFVLALAQKITLQAIHMLADSASGPQATISLLSAPAVMLAKLIPGLLLGWFTRRHPLVVGAVAGALAQLGTNAFFADSHDAYFLAGETITAAMIVAVAALAGRALRHRFRPQATR